MINWLTRNNTITGSYCLSKKTHTCHITSSLLQYVLKMSAAARTQTRRRWCHSTLSRSQCDSQQPTHCWCVVSVRQRPRSWYDRLAPN